MADHATQRSGGDIIDPRLEAASSRLPEASSLPSPSAPLQQPHHSQQRQHQYGTASTAQPLARSSSNFHQYYPAQGEHQHQPFPGDNGPPVQFATSSLDATGPKRSRACEACRNLKVKCEIEPGSRTCRRCAKTQRNCVITERSRKRQKADNKVAELEQRVEALSQEIRSRKKDYISDNEGGSDEEANSTQAFPTRDASIRLASHEINMPGNPQKRRFSEIQNVTYSGPDTNTSDSVTLPGLTHTTSLPHAALEARSSNTLGPYIQKTESSIGSGFTEFSKLDVIDRNILSVTLARELFDNYVKFMTYQMPIVVFPKNTNSDDLRRTSPLLFLAILSVSSGHKYHDLQATLKKETMSILVNSVVNGVCKSLETLQAIQVITVWYLPEPGTASTYFQLVHMATGIAIALGIDKKPAKKKTFSVLPPDASVLDTRSLESRRAWLGMYLLYSSIAMGMRHLNLIRNNEFLQECMTQLSDPESALDNDKTLCEMVYLQTLADQLSELLLPDQQGIMTESEVRSAHTTFDAKMRSWRNHRPDHLTSSSLALSFNVINLYMHELVMHHVASYEPGGTSTNIRSKNQPHNSPSDQPNPPNVVLKSITGIISNFVTLNVQEICTLPTFYFAQLSHASIALAKLYFVAQAAPDVKKFAPVSVDIVDDNLNRLGDSLRLACHESMAANTSLKMITMIQKVFEDHKNSTVEEIRARYGSIPSLKETQMLDLGEPEPTPQHRRAANKRNDTSAEDPLHMLSTVAIEGNGSSGFQPYAGESSRVYGTDSTPIDNETTAMGQAISEGDMAFMSDEGFFGVMQQMWSRSQ